MVILLVTVLQAAPDFRHALTPSMVKIPTCSIAFATRSARCWPQ
jgi:hypothetical protein